MSSLLPFADNDVDSRAVRDLTDQDLKDPGISLGRRRNMLCAMAEAYEIALARSPWHRHQLQSRSSFEPGRSWITGLALTRV